MCCARQSLCPTVAASNPAGCEYSVSSLGSAALLYHLSDWEYNCRIHHVTVAIVTRILIANLRQIDLSNV